MRDMLGPLKRKMQAGRGTAGRHSLGVLPRTDGLCRRKSSITEHLLTLKDGKEAFSAVFHSAQSTRYRGSRIKSRALAFGNSAAQLPIHKEMTEVGEGEVMRSGTAQIDQKNPFMGEALALAPGKMLRPSNPIMVRSVFSWR